MLNLYIKHCAVIGLLLVALSCQTGAKDSIKWVRDYKTATKLAAETQKPMFIDMWATWCGPCLQMQRDFWPRQDVVELSKKFVMVSIDIDADPETKQKYNAGGMPDLIFLDPWGNITSRKVGYGTGTDRLLISMMQKMPASFDRAGEFRKALEMNVGDRVAITNLGDFYKAIDAFEISNDYYKLALGLAEKEGNSDESEAILLKMGHNYFRLHDLPTAQSIYEKCLKDFPEGKQQEITLAKLITCLAFRKKISEAEKTLETLKQKFPSSAAIAEAEQAINQIKSLKK